MSRAPDPAASGRGFAHFAFRKMAGPKGAKLPWGLRVSSEGRNREAPARSAAVTLPSPTGPRPGQTPARAVPPQGETGNPSPLTLTWYGAAALVLRQGDAAIAFDPFFGMPVGCFAGKGRVSIPVEDFRGVTDVFVTHGHVDHIYHLPALCAASDFRIHCTPAPGKTLVGRGVPRPRIVPAAPGKTDRVPGFTVTAYRSRHCRYDLPIILQTVFRREFFRHPAHLARFTGEMLRFPEKGEILLYEVACAGKRVQVLGSLGLDPDTDYPTGADVLVLPFQGRSGLEEYALGIVRRLGPRAVLLDHYDDAFPPVSDEIDTGAFIKILRGQEHIPCRAMVKGKDIHAED